jgi:predicted SAM-dependent methyltransferase
METDQLIKPRRSPIEEDGIRRVQVGCGPHHIRPEWWNTDIRSFPGVDEVMDAGRPWHWQNTLEFVYAEHFLEHLEFEAAISFLVEAGRALQVGGRIRLTTPSLEWVIKTHFSFDTATDDARILDTFRINRAFHGWGHQFLYSENMLRHLLHEVGYADIEFCSYNQSGVEALRNLEKHGDYSVSSGYPSVWIVEAVKTSKAIAVSEVFRHEIEMVFSQYMRGGH